MPLPTREEFNAAYDRLLVGRYTNPSKALNDIDLVRDFSELDRGPLVVAAWQCSERVEAAIMDRFTPEELMCHGTYA